MHPPANDAGAPARRARWDLFCTVVDNYGDAGIAWRLARELCREHGIDVRLWIDRPAALARLAGVDRARESQRVDGIEVRARDAWRPETGVADVVVEILECGLPEGYVEAMHHAARAPQWFVLEYLSAESWVDDRHALPSPHPATGLARRFWFPGFTPQSGGLLRERGLALRRDAFLRDDAARRALWRSLGVADETAAMRVSLFCYDDAPLPSLLDAWRDGAASMVCVVPEGVASGPLRAWCDGVMPQIGAPSVHGALTLHAIPFLPQDRYDELLWSCDLNFVRGEDSFVRAQWAARAFAWHVYPQTEATHRVKLQAFAARYCEGLDTHAAQAWTAFGEAWNERETRRDMAALWEALMRHHDALREHAVQWASLLQTLPELATTLVRAAAFEV